MRYIFEAAIFSRFFLFVCSVLVFVSCLVSSHALLSTLFHLPVFYTASSPPLSLAEEASAQPISWLLPD
jgi:hypothetical protein